MTDGEARFEVQPSVANHFAWIRTVMGLQRTLLAAVRTSVSLIGFGFTVAQFFEKLFKSSGAQSEMARNLGLLLIGAGVISLAVFTWQYHRAIVYFRTGEFTQIGMIRERPMHTSVYLISFTVMLIGVAAFISVFLRF